MSTKSTTAIIAAPTNESPTCNVLPSDKIRKHSHLDVSYRSATVIVAAPTYARPMCSILLPNIMFTRFAPSKSPIAELSRPRSQSQSLFGHAATTTETAKRSAAVNAARERVASVVCCRLQLSGHAAFARRTTKRCHCCKKEDCVCVCGLQYPQSLVCVCLCAQVYVHVLSYICDLCVYLHICLRAHTCACVLACVHLFACTRMHPACAYFPTGEWFAYPCEVLSRKPKHHQQQNL